MTRLSKNQHWLLKQVAEGARLWRQDTGERDYWYMQRFAGALVQKVTLTARSLAHGYIYQQAGGKYWKPTDAGRRALAKAEGQG